jgi:HK97 gp10 family phage protein
MANNWTGGGVGGFRMGNMNDINIKMNKVGKVVSERLNRAAVKKALAPVVEKAKQLAPVGDPALDPLAGMLKDSIGEVVTNKKGVVRAIAGPIRRKVRVGTVKRGKHKGQPVFKDPARYAHLQEFGTSHHDKQPFMRPAWDQAGGEKALATYTETLNTSLDKEVAKIAKSS